MKFMVDTEKKVVFTQQNSYTALWYFYDFLSARVSANDRNRGFWRIELLTKKLFERVICFPFYRKDREPYFVDSIP